MQQARVWNKASRRSTMLFIVRTCREKEARRCRASVSPLADNQETHAPLPTMVGKRTLYWFPPFVMTLHKTVAGWSWRAPFFFFPLTVADSSTLHPPASKSAVTMALNRHDQIGRVGEAGSEKRTDVWRKVRATLVHRSVLQIEKVVSSTTANGRPAEGQCWK